MRAGVRSMEILRLCRSGETALQISLLSWPDPPVTAILRNCSFCNDRYPREACQQYLRRL
jgi:hypothetical protein